MTGPPDQRLARTPTQPTDTVGLATGPVQVGSRTGRRSRMTSRRRRTLANLMFAAPGTVFLAILALYPMWILVQMSISDVTITNILGYWPLVGLDNFRAVFSDPVFKVVTLQTVAFVMIILVVTMVAGTAFALALKGNGRLARVTQTTMILVWTLPPVIVGSLWKFLLASDGIISASLVKLGLVSRPVPFLSQPITSLAAIMLVSLWVGIPFATLVIKSAMLDISQDVLDAAKADGASDLQTILLIVLPLIRPTLLILGVLSVVGAFKAFDFIYVMTSGGPGTSSSTIPFLGYLTAFQSYQFGHASAISVVAMIIVLALAVGYIIAIRNEEQAR